jgi:hypothetical protein
VLALLAPLAVLLPSLQGGVVERKGPHFKVVSHLVPERLADEALEAAEAAWPLALAALDLKEKKLAQPLEIHLYPDAASYAAAEQSLTGGKFKANLAFSHFQTKSTHVALQPPCSPQALLELGLPALTLYLVAHEASHLVSYAHLPNSLDHLEWFAEGMATHVGLAALVSLGRMRPGLAEPLASKSLVHCKKLLADGKLPTAEQVLAAEIGDLDFYPRYGVSHRFYELLRAKHPKDLDKLAAVMRKQGGGEGFRAGVLGELGQIWKARELEKLQKEWLASVQEAEPEWDEHLRSLETRGMEGESYVQRGFGDTNAVAFRNQAPAGLPFTARGSLRAVPGAAHQMNFLLGRSDKGFLSVAFTFGQGAITVLRCDFGPPDTWTVLGTTACAGLVIGAEVPFRVEASAAELAVFVEDAEILRAPLHGRSPLGQWGLGAQAGTTGEWKGIAVQAGP